MTTMFSSARRGEAIAAMTGETFDVLVIGGGITGAGIALDAASRGLRVALVEMQDFSAGTSSRSTKLVHGGLRYLKQLEVKMVADVGKERAIVYENGPHVTTPEWMLLPLHEGGTFGRLSTAFGLRAYDFLAGVKREERRQMLTAAETLEREPLLKRDGLKGGGYYVEYRTDDARLTIEVLKEAAVFGAQAINYAKVEQFLYEGTRVAGVRVNDRLGGRTFEVRAARIVNAAGPWVGELRKLDRSNHGKTLRLTKGVHLVIDQSRFPLRQAVYFDTPDGRMVFAIPRDGKTYVGTTDTVYDEDLAHPRMTEADRRYILDAIDYMFPEVHLTERDVESSWAGIRPLILEEGKGPSEISRKDEIWQSPSGLITIAGGKLTGYRKMAEMVTDLVAASLAAGGGKAAAPCRTRHLPISGGHVGGSAGLAAYVRAAADEGVRLGLERGAAERLARRYGSNASRVFAAIPRYADEGAALGVPLELYLQAVYAMEEEMAATPADVFVRRTGALLFDIATVKAWKAPVVRLMAQRLGWTAEQAEAHAAELETLLRDAVEPQREPELAGRA